MRTGHGRALILDAQPPRMTREPPRLAGRWIVDWTAAADLVRTPGIPMSDGIDQIKRAEAVQQLQSARPEPAPSVWLAHSGYRCRAQMHSGCRARVPVDF